MRLLFSIGAVLVAGMLAGADVRCLSCARTKTSTAAAGS